MNYNSGDSAVRTVFLSFLLWFVSTPVWAAGITVGVSTGYPPYYYEEDGILTGFCVELVNGVASQMNLEVVYKSYPWRRLLVNARRGRVDAIMPLFRTEEREEFLDFDGLGIAYEINHLFTKKASTIEYQGDLSAIKQYRIGVVLDYSYGTAFDQFEGFQKVATLNDSHMIKMFAQGRFDIGVGNRYVTQYYAARQNLADQIRYLAPPLTKELLYIGFTKNGGGDQFARQFAKALKKFKQSAKYLTLEKKYHLEQ